MQSAAAKQRHCMNTQEGHPNIERMMEEEGKKVRRKEV